MKSIGMAVLVAHHSTFATCYGGSCHPLEQLPPYQMCQNMICQGANDLASVELIDHISTSPNTHTMAVQR